MRSDTSGLELGALRNDSTSHAEGFNHGHSLPGVADPAASVTSQPLPEALDAAMLPPDAFDAAVPDGGLHSWLIIAACSTLAFWTVGTNYSWGVLQAALVGADLAPASTLAFVGSLAAALTSCLAAANSRLLRITGTRAMAMAGVGIMGVAQICAGFATHSVAGLFVSAGVLMGLGVSLSFVVYNVVPVQYFARKRGTAIGIVYAAGGLGGASLSLGLEAGVRRFGADWTFRGLGVGMLVFCLPAAWFITERVRPVRQPLYDWSLFRDPAFVLLFAAGAFATFPLLVPPFFLPLYATSLSLPSTSGALLVALFNFSSALGRILTGLLSDRFLGPLNALLLSLMVTAATLLVLWPSSTSFAPLVVFVLLNGASNGAFFSIMPTAAASLLGGARMPVAFGMIVASWLGGYLMGAPAAGYLLAAFGGLEGGARAFRPAVLWAGAMAGAAAALVGVLRFWKNRRVFVRM